MTDKVMMLGLNKFVLTPGQILAIPSNDRALMLWCSHIHNELMTLLGLYRAVSNTTCSCAIEQEAKVTQELTVMKLIAGKLWEAWKLLEKGFFGTGLSNEYEILDPASAQSLKNIKKYFGCKNSLNTLRNNYAFHYEFDALKDLPAGWDSAHDELTFYAGTVPAHTLFFLSEVIISKSMFMTLGADNLAEGVQIFWKDIKLINEDVIAVCGAIFTLVVHKYIGNSSSEIACARIGVLNPPPITQPSVPFFVMP